MYRQQWAASRASYPSHGLFDVYPYLPWTSVLLLPFRLVFGDIRYGLVAALAVAAALSRAARRRRSAHRPPATSRRCCRCSSRCIPR